MPAIVINVSEDTLFGDLASKYSEKLYNSLGPHLALEALGTRRQKRREKHEEDGREMPGKTWVCGVGVQLRRPIGGAL